MFLRKLQQTFLKIMNADLSNVNEKVALSTSVLKKNIDQLDDVAENDVLAKKAKTDDSTQVSASDENSKIRKRKYALLVSYCGEGYYGLQR